MSLDTCSRFCIYPFIFIFDKTFCRNIELFLWIHLHSDFISLLMSFSSISSLLLSSTKDCTEYLCLSLDKLLVHPVNKINE